MNVASVDAFLRRYMYMVVLKKRDDENVQNRVSSTQGIKYFYFPAKIMYLSFK